MCKKIICKYHSKNIILNWIIPSMICTPDHHKLNACQVFLLFMLLEVMTWDNGEYVSEQIVWGLYIQLLTITDMAVFWTMVRILGKDA